VAAAALPVSGQTGCSGTDYLSQASAQKQLADYAGALASYTCILLSDPSNPTALLGRIEASLLARNYSIAAADAGRLKDYAPEIMRQALGQYEQTITRSPADIGLRMAHLLLNWALANDEAVLMEAEQLLQLDPANAFAYLMRGSSNQYLGDRLTPPADFQQAINLDSSNGAIFSIIGSTYVQTDDIINGLIALDRAIQLQPNDARSLYFRGLGLFYDGSTREAIADFTAAVQIDAYYYDAYYDRGRAYVELSDFEAALNDFSTVVSLQPRFELAYLNRGNVYEWTGSISNALPDFQQFITLNSGMILPPQQVAPGGTLQVNLQPRQTAQIALQLSAGQVVNISADSGPADPLLLLLGPDGQTALAGSDDPQPGERMPAIQSFVVPVSGVYVLQVTSADPARANQGIIDVSIALV
jgi:tetratricopeptide (TPR) repeat protein